jgi:hypothetical protein
MKEKIYFRKADGQTPEKDSLTKVCITNHIIEMKIFQKPPHNLQRFKRLSKSEYLDTETGEVKEYRRSTDGAIRNTNASFDYLRKLINLNFTGLPRELYITLTYANPVRDKKQLSKDFHRFWNKFKYHYPNCEYIAIYEPHATGSWHIHVLVRNSNVQTLFVPREAILTYWPNGNVWINREYKNDNIGAYYTAFRESNDFIGKSEKTDTQDTNHKKDRIRFYPANGKIFTASRGIRKPQTLTMSYHDALQLTHNATPCFSEKITIVCSDENGKAEINTITYQQFNSKRK